jgi:hypothetical protein
MSIVVRLRALYIAWLVATAAAEDMDAHATQTCLRHTPTQIFAYLPQHHHEPPGPVAAPIEPPDDPHLHEDHETKVSVPPQQMPPPSAAVRMVAVSPEDDWWQHYQSSHNGTRVFRNAALAALQARI